MAELLTPEWVALWAEHGSSLPPRPGASARLRWVVAGPAKSETRFDVVVTDGRVTEAGIDGAGEADVELAVPRATLAAIVAGELDSQVALMQGKVKTSATGPLLPVLPVLQSPEWRALEATIAAATG